MSVIPPPAGLDIEEIKTDAGLQAAIGREAAKLNEVKKNNLRVSKDTIRLIVFLAGEIRRRINNLSPQEKTELQRLRDTAEEREIERRSDEIIFNVDEFIGAINTPGRAVKLSQMNELEDQTIRLMKTLKDDAQKYAKLLEKMATVMEKLKAIKNQKKMLKGLVEF